MEFKKILVAVDASDNARRAVEYTGQMVGCMRKAPEGDDFHVTLLHVERLPDRDLFPDEPAWKQSCLDHQQSRMAALKDARALLLAKGLPETMVETRYLKSCRSPLRNDTDSCNRGTSIAQEILDMLKQEGYGTAVVGRRGMSKAEEFLFGSVSNKIIHSARDCTVWVVA